MHGEMILKDTRTQKSTVENVDVPQVAKIRARVEKVFNTPLEETGMSEEVFETQRVMTEYLLTSLEASVENRIARLNEIIHEEEDAKKELLKLLGFT